MCGAMCACASHMFENWSLLVDMAEHFQMIAKFNTYLETEHVEGKLIENQSNMDVVMSCILHASGPKHNKFETT